MRRNGSQAYSTGGWYKYTLSLKNGVLKANKDKEDSMGEQYHSARAMIKGLCSNYDNPTGGCLLRSREELVKCPQLNTGGLVCRFFWDVLLEDPDSRTLKAEIMGNDHIIACACCGLPFRAVSLKAKYCVRCARAGRKEAHA